MLRLAPAGIPAYSECQAEPRPLEFSAVFFSYVVAHKGKMKMGEF